MKSLAKVFFQSSFQTDFEDEYYDENGDYGDEIPVMEDIAVEVDACESGEMVGMQCWDETQYGAWVMYGVASIINSLYWM